MEKAAMRKATVGDYGVIANFSCGGMSYERAYNQMKRFADKVMPKLKENPAVAHAPGGLIRKVWQSLPHPPMYQSPL